MSDKALMKQKRIFEIIEVGNDLDYPSRIYDFINAFSIIFNVTASLMYTFPDVRNIWGTQLLLIEKVTVAFFLVDYCLRVWTARFLYPEYSEVRARKKYIMSFTGIVDLISFLPYYLPVFFPTGMAAFRMIRIVRIFRLFKINSYYDSLSVISAVIAGKKQQLFSSCFIILILMVASSLCMYSVEHEAQPDVFTNAFSGIWWSASTLLTVGYGDIYPVTTMGKILGILITGLGVGMVAIPTGIISAGFVEQYSSIKKRSEIGYSADMNFIKIFMNEGDSWVGKKIMELGLPAGVIVAIVRRNGDNLIPRGNLELRAGDTIVIGSEPYNSQEHIKLKELVLERKNPWTGELIKDLDISRHSIIVLVKRGNKSLIPKGNMRLEEGDKVFLYTHLHLAHTNEIEI